jgi:hypothetical protein
MYTEQEILNLIKEKIETDENLGDQSGGSGHMGFKSYKIDGFKTKQLDGANHMIIYQYTVFVETEFTYYPDKPPQEYTYEKTMIINRKKSDKELS